VGEEIFAVVGMNDIIERALSVLYYLLGPIPGNLAKPLTDIVHSPALVGSASIDKTGQVLDQSAQGGFAFKG